MKIKNAEKATEMALMLMRKSINFRPLEAKRVDGVWEVKALIGALDDVKVTVEIPEDLLVVE